MKIQHYHDKDAIGCKLGNYVIIQNKQQEILINLASNFYVMIENLKKIVIKLIRNELTFLFIKLSVIPDQMSFKIS